MLTVLVLFFMTLGKFRTGAVQGASLLLTALTLVVTFMSLGAHDSLFFDAYQVDSLSQLFKLVIVGGLFLVFFPWSRSDRN